MTTNNNIQTCNLASKQGRATQTKTSRDSNSKERKKIYKKIDERNNNNQKETKENSYLQEYKYDLFCFIEGRSS